MRNTNAVTSCSLAVCASNAYNENQLILMNINSNSKTLSQHANIAYIITEDDRGHLANNTINKQNHSSRKTSKC